MLIRFDERFDAPVEELFRYFATPADWVGLYGRAGAVRDLGGGWFAVPLKGFPFPLIARTTELSVNQRVRWIFRGFWRGDGEILFTPAPGGVRLSGHERIAVRWLFFLSPVVEKLFLEKRFHAVWQLGWQRLRRRRRNNT